MSRNHDPVFAAIPGVGSPEALEDALSVLSHQDYDDILIRQTDEPTDEVRDAISDLSDRYSFSYVTGFHPTTPGEARNELASYATSKVGSYGDAILHFIDPDMRVMQHETPARRIRDHLSDPEVGMGGGLVLTAEGNQSMYNYGPVFSLKSGIGALKQAKAERILKEHSGREAGKYRDKQGSWLYGWPDTTTRPEPWPAVINERQMRTSSDTAWVHEGNLFIQASNLRRGGGFEKTGIHEVQGLGVQLRKQGLKVVFDPHIAVKHRGPEKPIGNLAKNLAATALLAGKHGVFRYIKDS